MLEIIHFKKQFTSGEIIEALNEVFPALDFKEIKIEDYPEKEDQRPNTVYLVIQQNKSEFPMTLELYNTAQENTAQREQFIAWKLSKILGCRILVGYQEKEFADSPFHNLIFDGDKIFLATDLESKLSGDGDQNVKIADEREVKIAMFNSKGQLID